MSNLCTVIFFDKDGMPKKYRKIKPYYDEQGVLVRTSIDAFARLSGAVSMNVYDKETKQFLKQLKIQ